MKRKLFLPIWIHNSSTLLILIVPLLAIAILTDLFGSILLNRIVLTMFIHLTLVLGLQIFMGIGAYASVLFSMDPQMKEIALPELYTVLTPIHLPFLPSLLIGASIATLIAAVVSYPLMRLSDAAAVITTFALLVIIHVILVHWDNVTNGPQTLFGVEPYTTLWTSVIWGIAFVVVAYWFKESSMGLKLRASRDDEYAASTCGINIVVVRWVGFTLSAFVAGIGGGLWAHFITSFSPKAFYLKETFVILAMLVVGGPGSVSGAVVGTLAVTAAREGLRAIENAMTITQLFSNTLVGFTEVCLAIALIVILILRPAGIMGGREIRWPKK